jgi:hypothetical protein
LSYSIRLVRNRYRLAKGCHCGTTRIISKVGFKSHAEAYEILRKIDPEP